METLFGIEITSELVRIKVVSNGCTDGSDFEISISKSSPPQISFDRIREDVCRLEPALIWVDFPIEKIGTTEFIVANQFAAGSLAFGGDGKKLHEPVSWRAFANLFPPSPYEFHVAGTITVPHPGYSGYLVPAVPQGFNPRVLILNLKLCESDGSWPQVVSELPVSFEDTWYADSHDSVDVRLNLSLIHI